MAREYNMIYKHADGNNLILENTANDKIEKMNLNAETVIDNLVAAGKNILDPFTDFHPEFDGLTSTITEDGYITVTGVPKYDYVSIVGFTNLTDILEDGATYTLSMTDNNSYVWCEVTAVQNGSNKVWYSSRNNASFTVDKSTYQYRVRILTATVSTWGSSSRTITSAFQLEKGSKTAYEPFSFTTREPSPTNPTEINVLEKDVNVRFTTRNLLGKKTGTYVNNGITFTANEDGSITANGTASANANWYFYSGNYEQPELPNGVYTISGCPSGGSSSTYYFRVIKKDGVGALTYWQDFGSGRDFTIESDSTIACHIHIESGQTVNNLTFYPQIIIKDDNISDYTPGNQQNIELNFGTDIFLGTLNDLKNKIYYKDGKWYYSQEIGKVILDGTEEGVRRETNTSGKWRFCIECPGVPRVPNSTTIPIIMSDKFKVGTLTNQYTLINCISTGITTNEYYRDISIYYDAIDTYTFAEFQSWLTNNNITVLYQLATPSVTEITNETLLTQLNTLRNAVTYDDYTTVKFLDGTTKEILKSGLISFDYSLNNSNEYFQALIDNTATIETIVNVLPLNEGEETINLNEENSVINWTHSDFRYVQNTEDKSQAGFIGQFVARTFDGKVIDLDDDFNIENHEIEVYLGIVNEEDTGYISLGNFIIESIERDEVDDTTSFKSSDYTMFFNQKFNGDYTDGTFTDSFNTKIQNGETVTALWLAQYTCAQAGVTLGHTDFTNYDYVIASNQFDDQHTCRDVIKSIAKLAYSWARIGWDNKLYFDFTVDTEVNTTLNSIDNDHYYNLETQKEEYGVINKVIVGSSIVSGNNQYIEDETSIEENGEHEIVIYDNPITYNDDTKIAALEQGNVLYGLHYRPLSVTTTGHPWLQGNELIEIIDMEGNSIYTYPFDRVIEYNGHIKTKLDSYGATEVEATYTYEGTDNVNRQTKVELDRQNQRLTVAISELTGEIQDVSDEFNKLAEPSHTVRGTEISVDDGGEFNFKNFGIYGQLQQGDLPVRYTPVEYITNGNNNCYINMLYPKAAGSEGFFYSPYLRKYEFKFSINDLSKDGYIYGDSYTYLQYTQTSGLVFHINSNTTITLLDDNNIDTNIHTYYIDDINHTFKVDDGTEQSYTNDGGFAVAGDRFIFNKKKDWGTDNSVNINLYALKIYDLNGTLAYNLIPVYDNDNEMYGLYSNNSDTFFRPNNSTLFSSGNEIIPTCESPIDIYPVKLEHQLNIQSKNLINLENQSGIYDNITISAEDGVFIINGSDSEVHETRFNQTYTYLEPGIYTFTCKVSGECTSEDGIGATVGLFGVISGGAALIIYSGNLEGTYPEFSKTFGIVGNEPVPTYFTVSSQANIEYNNYKIEVCIEKSDGTTGVSKHEESQNYTYNLNDIELYGIDNYNDSISYNITDEKWYLNKHLTKKNIADIVQTTGASNTEYTVYKTYDANASGFGTTFKILSKDLPCLSTHFKWGGAVSSDTEALSKGEGIYTNYISINTYPCPILYVVMPNDIVSGLSSFKTWCQDNDVNIYYIHEDPVIEELPDYDLVIQLDEILANAKLYDTDMIISDSPVSSESAPAELEITYMFNTPFNGSYATRTELQVTQNSIQSVVADTVSTTLDPITLGLEDLGDRIGTVEGNLQGDIDELRGDLGDYALQTDVVTLERSVTELQTSTAEVISVAKSLQLNGVEKVRTSTDYTFDENGLMIAKTGAATKTQVTENGMSIYSTAGSTDEAMLTVNSQGVDAYNVKVGTYLLIGSHARMQDYEDGTGVFYIG